MNASKTARRRKELMNRAFKYRIYPTTEQTELFVKTFGCCRFIWNAMLSDKKAHYEATGKSLSVTPAAYKKDYPFLKEVDSLALANVQLQLQTAYKNFFLDKSVGFPKYKSKKHPKKSYTTNNQNGTVAVLADGIRLPKIGIVPAVVHRCAPEEWNLKSATVSQESDGSFYCSVLYEYTPAVSAIEHFDLSDTLGIDYKTDGLYTDSNGLCADMPHFYRKTQKRLAKEQRRLSRKVGSRKGETKSKNYLKQLQKVNKLHRHVANQRKDYLHKLSAEITNQYGVICVEDLHMRAMSNKGFGIGKATLDNGNGMFLSMLAYKQEAKGHYYICVDKYYPSSQLTHCCNIRCPEMKDVKRRHIICPKCGKKHDRDYNAAINIRKEGYRIYQEMIKVTA